MNCRLFSQRDYYIIESRIVKLLLVNNPLSKNEILNSTVRLCGGIYSNTVDIYYFI